MQLQELKLLNFRNYERIQVSFDPNLNIIYGKNGEGKTNLVEAIYVLAWTRSFKQVKDAVLIRNNTNLAKIEGVVLDKVQNTYRVILTDEGKTVQLDHNKITKISDYIARIPIVLFSPSDLKMIKDTPSIRRKYLNITISQLNISYLQELNQYNKLLKIRNAYLKKMYVNGNSLMTYLDVVTEKLIDIGLILYEKRKKWVEELNPSIRKVYQEIAGEENLVVHYVSDYEKKNKEQLISYYKKNLSRDISLGKTNFGIHHDDFCFLLDGYDLKDYGSQGQQKNAIIAWKFSELQSLKNLNKVSPILILDDLLSELDKEKIKNIISFISEDVQTFITTTEIEKLEDLIKKKKYKKIYVQNGKLEEV